MSGQPKPEDQADPPLAATLRRATAALDGECVVQLGGVDGGRWLELDRVLDGDGLAPLFADRAEEAGSTPAYLGASVAAGLAGAMVTAGWVPLLLDGRLPDISPANLAVRRHPEGWFDRIALRSAGCTVLADDPAAGHPGVGTVDDLAQLHRRLAAALVVGLGPWFEAVRRQAPFGRTGMWGQVADELCGTAVWVARRAGRDQDAAWAEAHTIVDLVAARVPELRARPRPFPVTWRGGEALFSVKGTCCLWYKTQAAPDPCAEGYCGSCPLRHDDSRRARFTGWLEEQEAGR